MNAVPARTAIKPGKWEDLKCVVLLSPCLPPVPRSRAGRRWAQAPHPRRRRRRPFLIRCRSMFLTARRSPPIVPRRWSPPRWPRPRSRRATGSWRSRWSIRTGISSTSTRWIRPRLPRSASRRARPVRRPASDVRLSSSSMSCRRRPAPMPARSTRRWWPLPAASLSSRAARSSARSGAAAPPAIRTRRLQGGRGYRQVIDAERQNGPRRWRRGSYFQSRAYPINGFFFRPSRIRMAPMMASTSETG